VNQVAGYRLQDAGCRVQVVRLEAGGWREVTQINIKHSTFRI